MTHYITPPKPEPETMIFALVLCLSVGLCVTFCGEPDLYDAVIFALMGGN